MFGRLRSLVLLPLAFVSLLLITGCSPSSIITGLLSGGGPNVAANVQAGKTNTQAVVSNSAPEVVLKPKSRVDSIDQSQTTNNELPLWVWIVLIVTWIVGWVTDTPATIVKQMRRRHGKDT